MVRINLVALGVMLREGAKALHISAGAVDGDERDEIHNHAVEMNRVAKGLHNAKVRAVIVLPPEGGITLVVSSPPRRGRHG